MARIRKIQMRKRFHRARFGARAHGAINPTRMAAGRARARLRRRGR